MDGWRKDGSHEPQQQQQQSNGAWLPDSRPPFGPAAFYLLSRHLLVIFCCPFGGGGDGVAMATGTADGGCRLLKSEILCASCHLRAHDTPRRRRLSRRYSALVEIDC